MNDLKLPEQLQGPWHHALILTYGMDIPFLENALWRQFSTRCRNKIILADGRQYLEACANYARSGLVRHLNQQYVAEGIFAPRAAHAKLILLTNPEQGRLLVGSGNLRWQGYASGGELFTQYEYSPNAPEALNAFLAVRELVEDLAKRRYIGAQAERRIRYLLENTPWLFQSSLTDGWPVRHNLTHSFLDQLQQAVGDDPVEELWVLSPFYDPEAVALERLLTTLNPRRATLLVQSSYTSVDPTALRGVLDRFRGRCRVCSFSIGSDTPYVHAKLYLLKLSGRAICLQGSPNLTQAAMLLTAPQGNIEVASLLFGPRDAFDDLLDALEIQPEAARLDTLDLSYQPTEIPTDEPSDGWRLIGGEWYEDRLHLSFQGEMPELEGASLIIAGRVFPLDVCKREPGSLELRLSPDAAALLGRPVPVSIRWDEGDDAPASNPIFVCNRAALDAVLEIADEGETLDRIGDLDLDDEELERLLGELDAALMIDRRSVWQLAGRIPPSTTDDNDEALRLDYADVDYEMLRRHPKIQQYRRGISGGRGYTRSRLQIILNAITDHFRGLLDVPVDTQREEVTGGRLDEDSEAETEEEREREEEEKENRRRTQAQRVRRLLKGFIRRYLQGIRSSDFQKLAGFEVIAQNYVIFSHILWRLFGKDWVEPEFVLESLLQTWGFFWGTDGQTGYFGELEQEQQAQVLQWVREYHADAELLAALYYGAHLTRTERREDLRFALRDFWRAMLCHPPFSITAEILEETWHIVTRLIPYEPPPPTVIVNELTHLVQFETRDNFLRALEERYSSPRGSCTFTKQTVWREPLRREDTVHCLLIRAANALPSKETAVALLQAWMRFEDLDYYRIHNPLEGRILYYETLEQTGVYWARDQGGEPAELGFIAPRPASWDGPLSQLRVLAVQVDAGLVLPRAKTALARVKMGTV